MKKFVTLLLFVSAFALSSFAQYGRDDQGSWNNGNYDRRNDRSYDRNYDRRGNDFYNYTTAERDREIEMISRNYDRKIDAVERDWFMNRRRKREIIQNLEFQKEQEIRMVYAKFNNNRNQCSPSYSRGGYDRRYDRRNNW